MSLNKKVFAFVVGMGIGAVLDGVIPVGKDGTNLENAIQAGMCGGGWYLGGLITKFIGNRYEPGELLKESGAVAAGAMIGQTAVKYLR